MNSPHKKGVEVCNQNSNEAAQSPSPKLKTPMPTPSKGVDPGNFLPVNII